MSRPADSGNARYLVPGLVRGMQILGLFRADRRMITAPEMAAELGIPRSTVFRLAQTLEHLGLLERVAYGNAFRLGIGVLRLGFEYLAVLDVNELAGPVIDGLSEATGLASHHVIRDGREVVVVYKAAGRSPFSGSLSVGSRLPAHATVLGRMTLLDLSDGELEALYGDGPLKAYTDQTPTDLDGLRRLLARDRARGYGISDSFFEKGISAVAAPVRDHTGRAFGAINVTIVGRPADAAAIDRLVADVRAAADRLSAAHNYRPETDGGELRHAG